jgi:hypothetical protein
MKKLVLLLGVLISTNAFALGGGTVGNGGDPHVIEYLKISDELCKWAVQSAPARFAQIKKCLGVVSDFQASLRLSKKAKIEFVSTPLVDSDGIAKVAIFDLNNGSVKVNRPLWRSFERKDKYVTAAIELAGLSNIKNRYDFGSLVDTQFAQVFASIKFPEFACTFGSHEGPINIAKIQFSKADIDEYNKDIKDISTDPNASCGICRANTRISISEKNNPSGYQIKVDREYLIDRPFRLIVSLLNSKGQLENQSTVDAYADFVELEYFSQGLEFQCERENL